MIRRYLSIILPLYLAIAGVLSAAPATLVQSVTYNSVTVSLRLTRENLRGTNFELWAQNSTGAYDVITPVDERSYIGTVDGYPGAVSYGILQDNGVFKGGVIFDRGGTWYVLGNTVTSADWLTQPYAYGFTWETVGAGQGGSSVYGFDVGIDARFEYFNERGGGSLAKTLEMIEYSVTQNRALYLHDALLRPFLARVIIRANAAMDPAKGLTQGTYLDAVRNEWNNNQTSANRDVVAGISTSHVWAGLAWVGVIATNSAYSVNDSQGDGNFNKVWQHELGHNWGLSHYDGGAPEKGTINSDNHYARMSGPELRKVLNQRNAKLGSLDNLGPLTTVNIPPYASYDPASFSQGVDSQITINVKANDHDANGHALVLISVDSTTVQGGTASVQGQQVVYKPRWDFIGVDSFTYLIQDSSGQTATGAVAVDVQSGDRLRLSLPVDEITGTTAYDKSVFVRNGTLTGTDFPTATTAGKFGNAVNLDGVDDHISASGIKLNSNTVTLTAWIKPGAVQNQWSGIIFDRSSTTSGLHLGTAGELRYTWNNTQFNWNSGLVPAANVWTFVALVVEPGKATIYMNNGSGFQTAVNNVAHAAANFGTVNIGWDPEKPARHFTGAIDEARMYNAALTSTELQSLVAGGGAESPSPYNGATNVGPVDLSWASSAVAVQYRVYLGTNAAAVQNATTASPEYLGTVTTPRFLNPPTTVLATNYWRVDVETATGIIIGPVWSFTRNGVSKVTIGNFSFEDGPIQAGTPPAWTLTAGSAANLGTATGGSDGPQKLYIGPGLTIRQDLSHTLMTGATLTLKYDSTRNYQRNIQLLAKNGGTYTLMAETTAPVGVTAWSTITLNHTVAATYAGQQLAIRIISGNWNEFDNFRLTVAAPPSGSPNNPPTWNSNPVVEADAAENAAYSATLASDATDLDGDLLTFSKVSGPAWLTVASDGTLIGVPATANIGSNSFIVRVTDPAGGQADANLTIVVRQSQFLYDINAATAGSGAAGGGTWGGTAQWTSHSNGTTATFGWVDGATPVFAAGTDALGDYTVTNTAPRPISGFISRSGRPLVTGGSLQPSAPATPFNVEATALGARIDSSLTGTGGIAKSGPGPLVLGGNNLFTGNISITAGVLELASGARLYNGGFNNSAVLTVSTGGTWRLPDYSYGGVGQLADYRQRRVIDGGTIEVTGNSHSSGQDFTVNATDGTLRYTPVGQTLTLSGNTSSNISTAGVLTFDTIGNIGVTGTSANIEGGGSVVKTGTGNLTLGNGGNSFSGNLTATNGKLLATAASVAPNTALGARVGTRTVAINAPGSMDWTINNVIGVGGGLTAAKLPTIALNGSNLKTTRFNVLGNATLNGGSLVNSNATDPVNYDGFQFIGIVTATGTTPSAIITTTAKGNHLLGGGTTEFSVTDASGLLTVSTVLRNGSTDYPGIGSLRKSGPGTLVLAATNVYTGTTTVDAGTLALGGTLTSATTVSNTGKLSGTGTITASVTVQSGGTLAPDTGTALNTGALTLASGSTLLANGRTSVTGNVTLNGAHVTTTVTGPRILISFTGTRTGEFTSTVPAGWQIELDDVAKEIRLIAVPAGYNSWIAGYPTNGKSGLNDDADTDGVSNGLEFYLGGDPMVSGDTALPILAPAAGGGFTYTFTRAARARDNCIVTAKLSDDMLTWPPARDIVIGALSGPGITITDQGDHDAISILVPGVAPRAFVRLEVSAPSSP